MKEKSLLKMLLIAIFAIMSVGFVACGSDDEADDEPRLAECAHELLHREIRAGHARLDIPAVPTHWLL